MKSNNTKFTSRNEVFGKTVFDRYNFSFHFMGDEQFSHFEDTHDVNKIDNETFPDNPRILSAPIRSYFDLTLRCNLSCITCLNNSGDPMDDELDTSECLEIIEKLAQDGVFQVKFSGGEPTLKRDWSTIMGRAKELGLSVTMNSNGLYGRRTLREMVDLKPDEVTISLDGFEDRNDAIRGKGTYDRAVRTIKYLNAEGIRVCINTVVTRELTERDVHGLVSLASEHCYDISFFHPRPIGRAAFVLDQLPTYSELEEFMAMVDRIKSEYTGTHIETRSHSVRENALGLLASQVGLMTGGSDGFTRFNIMPTGKMYAGGCVPYVSIKSEQDVVLGNIRNHNYSILPVWRRNPRLWRIRRESHDLQERCNGCSDYRTSCSGFTLDMELFRKVNGDNPYCKY